MTILYETVFSRVRNKINDPKELQLEDEDSFSMYTERLHSVLGNIKLAKLFKSLSYDDNNAEISCVLKDIEFEDSINNEYVIELLTLGMLIEWLEPQVNSILYHAPIIGGKEEKKLLENHKNMINRLNGLKIEFDKKIRDKGTRYNSYLIR